MQADLWDLLDYHDFNAIFYRRERQEKNTQSAQRKSLPFADFAV
jgi:hypothetical protein